MEILNVMVRQRTSDLELANASLQKEVMARQQTEDALRLSEERFAKAFKASPIPIAILAMKTTRHIDVNDSFLEMTGYSKDDIIGHTPEDLSLWEHVETWRKILLMVRETNSVRNLECQIRTLSGQIRDTVVFVEVFNLAEEPHLLVIIQDITERLQLEMQLRQQNKIQAVGQLSAGIAHDFNNLLTIIQGHASMYLVAEQLDQEVQASMKEIAIAADRAAQLTRQLLAFSRKQIMQRGPLDLVELVCNMSKMIHRLIGENIKFELDLASELPPVFADGNQMEQVIMNLTINARDAMPKGGSLIFRARPVVVDGNIAMGNCETRPGQYVCFSVIDTGSGIDPKIQSRIFEPFFTTKDVGKGSGMGLAMVDGIVKQHGGWINLISQVNLGSAFEIYIPVCENQPSTAPSPADQEPKIQHAEKTILFVEDEPGLLKLGRMVLTRRGYRVLSAVNGCEALDLWQKHKEKIDLLFTDMVMPEGVSGKDLARKLVSEKQELKVIFSSGYTNEILDHERNSQGHLFLPKPYKTKQLLETVDACLCPKKKKPRIH
jgi:PAS domain S-box-containing protein